MQGMSIIVKTVVRFVSGIIMLFGVYLLVHGETSPGGGFAGGIILASAFILIALAFGKKIALKRLNENTTSMLQSISAVVFMCLLFVGEHNILGFSMMVFKDISLGVLVWTSIYSAFINLISFRSNRKVDL